jgi:tripartite-type tricarboxylate transporter receptor subunit TctC
MKRVFATRAFAVTVSLMLMSASCAPTVPATFPSGRPITIIVPYAAGGTTDATARMLAAGLEEQLGTSVQIMNRPGAASQVAMTQLIAAEPDGFTLSYAVLPTVINHYLDPERNAQYSLEDFQLVAHHWLVPGMIAVGADSPYQTLDDLIAAARESPGTITVSDSGLLGSPHLMMLMLEKVAGVDFASVHFDGGAPSVTALLGGHVTALAGGVSDAVTRVRSGDLRVLAIAAEEESEFLEDVPTMVSLGYDVIAVSVAGIVAPSGTPTEVVDMLSAAIGTVVTSDLHERELRRLGDITPLYLGPAEYAESWRAYEARLEPLLQEIRGQ